jgi:hypothetical protein
MAVSFLYLGSRNYLDVIAGAVGFLAGTILAGAGVLALAVQSRSPSSSLAAVRVTHCLVAFLPPAAAILAWPVLYFGAFLFGLVLMPIVLIVCISWAWVASKSVAAHLSALLGWSCVGVLRGLVFLAQLVAILGSVRVFGCLLDLLESMGYKVGWS